MRPLLNTLNPQKLDAIRELLERYMADRKLPGYACLVSQSGKEIAYYEGGLRDVARSLPVTRDTVFRIYSMTKPLTSVAVMQLVEQGKLRLDDPIARFMPGWEDLRVFRSGDVDRYETIALDRPITILDLLTHTAGLTYGFQDAHVVDALYRKHQLDTTLNRFSAEELLSELQTLPLQFQPGSHWNYSVATDVLGYLVEDLVGQPLDQVFRERITGPLGMDQTDFVVAESARAKLAACYLAQAPGPEGALFTLYDDPATSPWLARPKFLSGGGGLVSTIDDYHRFCRAMLHGGALGTARILEPETVNLMTRNHLPGGAEITAMGQSNFSESYQDGIGFGLGFSVVIDADRTGGRCSNGEFAWGGLASTAFWIDPLQEIIAIFMTQLIPSRTWPVRTKLRDVVYGALEPIGSRG